MIQDEVAWSMVLEFKSFYELFHEQDVGEGVGVFFNLSCPSCIFLNTVNVSSLLDALVFFVLSDVGEVNVCEISSTVEIMKMKYSSHCH